jgi:hypothetical protein
VIASDTIAFYDGNKFITDTTSSIVPPVGARISIFKATWVVVSVDYEVGDALGIKAVLGLKKIQEAQREQPN